MRHSLPIGILVLGLLLANSGLAEPSGLTPGRAAYDEAMSLAERAEWHAARTAMARAADEAKGTPLESLALQQLSQFSANAGDTRGAEAALLRLLASRQGSTFRDRTWAAETWIQIARLRLRDGDATGAETAYRAGLRSVEEGGGPLATQVALLHGLRGVLQRQGAEKEERRVCQDIVVLLSESDADVESVVADPCIRILEASGAEPEAAMLKARIKE